MKEIIFLMIQICTDLHDTRSCTFQRMEKFFEKKECISRMKQLKNNGWKKIHCEPKSNDYREYLK